MGLFPSCEVGLPGAWIGVRVSLSWAELVTLGLVVTQGLRQRLKLGWGWGHLGLVYDWGRVAWGLGSARAPGSLPMFMFCDGSGSGCLERWASITAGSVPGFLVSEVPTCSSGPSLPNVLEAPVSADLPQVQSTVRAASRRALLLFMVDSGGDS